MTQNNKPTERPQSNQNPGQKQAQQGSQNRPWPNNEVENPNRRPGQFQAPEADQ